MTTPEKVLEQGFGLTDVTLKKLDGYISTNYHVHTSDGEDYVLKLYPQEESREVLDAEDRVLLHLSQNMKLQCSHPKKNREGKYCGELDHTYYRLLHWVDGTFLAEASHNNALLQDVGKQLAQIDRVLATQNEPVYAGRPLVWDLDQFLSNAPMLAAISDLRKRNLASYFFQHYKLEVLPHLASLPKQLIHGDGNDWNILVKDDAVHGLIDFGDMAYSSRINELAIALPYVLFAKNDVLVIAANVVRCYHEVFPLQPLEVELLYWLIAARLCTTVVNAAQSKIDQPDNAYTSVSEDQAWRLLEKWISISPKKAANKFLAACGFQEQTAPDATKVLEARLAHTSTALSTSYETPILMERAAFQYMFAADGTTYLDAYNNIPHVGHAHPVVVEAAQRQMAVLNTNTRYLGTQYNSYVKKLLAHFPQTLNKVFFVNSGSAANDLALRLVHAFHKNGSIAVLEHGYHGNTALSLSASSYKYSGKGGAGKAGHILELPLPDPKDENAAQAAIALIKREKPAAFIAEPIVGCGGQVPLPDNYLEAVYKAMRNQGGLCISDEVQVGFGRLGTHFWGYEKYGVQPDIVVLGKPIGNGHPMAAVVCTDEVASAFENGMEFFSSFGGNNVSCAIGEAVLDVMRDEKLQQHAAETGDYYLQSLRELQQKYRCIGEVRGSGLFIGLEVMHRQQHALPGTALAKAIKERLKNEHRILVSTDGPFDNVIKSKPPLCFNRQNVDAVIAALNECLEVLS